MRCRVIEKNNLYYPQQYYWFFGFRDFVNTSGSVFFPAEDAAIQYCVAEMKEKNPVFKVVWDSEQ